MSKGFEFVGGPLDGGFIILPDDAKGYSVVCTATPSLREGLSDAPLPIWEGSYVVNEDGCSLIWEA